MVRRVFFVVVLALILIGPLVYAGPQLASDLAVGEKWQLADDLAIRQFKCTKWYFLVSTCQVEYDNGRDRGRVGGTLNYLVLGGWSGERARLLRSSNVSDRIGTTLGVEHMRQRLISFGVFVVLALAFMAVMSRLVLSAKRSSAPATSGAAVDRLATPVSIQPFGKRTTGGTG